MKFVLGLAAALIFATFATVSTPVMAKDGAKSAAETGSNATDTQGAGTSKKSGGKKKKM